MYGFTYVGRSDPVARLQVGNNARNLEDAMVSEGGEPEASDRRLSGGSDRKSAPPGHGTQDRKEVEVGVTRDEREVGWTASAAIHKSFSGIGVPRSRRRAFSSPYTVAVPESHASTAAD